MKRYFIIIFIFSLNSFSQTLEDAFDIGYTYNTLGSPRFNSLGGAMGALGQDLSSTNINPASGAISRNSYVGFSLNNSFTRDNSSFYNVKNGKSNYDFNLNQYGFLLSKYIQDSESGFKGISFGVNYNLLKNLNQNIIIRNAQSNNSIIQSFVKNANYFDYQGIGEVDEVEGLAKHLGIIKFDPLRPANNRFYTDVTDFNNQKTIDISKNGSIGEYSISGAFNYDDLFFLGISYIHNPINSYDRNINISEKELDINYNQTIITKGYGNGFLFGVILKPSYFLRLGLSYKTSIEYDFTDTYTYRLNGLQDDIYQYKYSLNTPSTTTFSGAFILGQIGLLSFDYENKNYSDMSFFNENYDDFSDINDQIKNNGKDSYNLRIGSEFRWLIFRTRTGFSYTSSPRKDFDNGNFRLNFGLGMIINQYDFDISYGYLSQKYQTYIYDKEIVDPITTQSNQSFITLSFNYHFSN